MIDNMAEPNFDAPIPGMSLTHEVGARPWQTPPQYTTVEEALDYYIPRFANDDVTDQLMDVLEMGVPVSTVANNIQLAGVMEGKHSVDVGMLVIPVLMELIMYMADKSGIDYNTGMEKSTEIKSTQVDKALAKLQDEAEEEKEDVDSTETDEVTDDIVSTLREVATERATGLMGRRG
tara:strand:+ start:955 stop:1485 length:531 start_codon:yes stop_codon:yes gene_type:complete